MAESIHFIMTGGTVDSYYEGTRDTVMPYEHSIIPDYIKGLKLHEKAEFTEVCMKDSRDINEADLSKIVSTIEDSKHRIVIITHGTYSMPDTAKFLRANLKRKDQVIIFTGSMVPIEFPRTDATFNLGYTMAKSHHMEPGIYVCMNGRVFDPNEVAKLLREGRFISIFGEKK